LKRLARKIEQKAAKSCLALYQEPGRCCGPGSSLCGFLHYQGSEEELYGESICCPQGRLTDINFTWGGSGAGCTCLFGICWRAGSFRLSR